MLTICIRYTINIIEIFHVEIFSLYRECRQTMLTQTHTHTHTLTIFMAVIVRLYQEHFSLSSCAAKIKIPEVGVTENAPCCQSG